MFAGHSRSNMYRIFNTEHQQASENNLKFIRIISNVDVKNVYNLL